MQQLLHKDDKARIVVAPQKTRETFAIQTTEVQIRVDIERKATPSGVEV